MTMQQVELRSRGSVGALLFAVALSAAACGAPEDARDEHELAESEQALERSANPPGGLLPSQVPQFVAVTFDDNFVAEGMDFTVDLFANLKNPVGSGNPATGTFDNTPARSTYYHNCTYLGHMESSWRRAVNAGHETADHTTNHNDGLGFSVAQWSNEIDPCRTQLMSTFGLTAAQVSGFRAPFLKYNNNLFTAIKTPATPFAYDTSIPSCMKSTETGKNCPWPYTLDSGSVDSADRNALNSDYPVITSHPGFWEMPVATAFVPPEHQAGIPTNQFAGPGRVIAMDISMFLDAKMTKAQSLAALKHTLDLRIAGNRAPLVFVGHTHVYAGNWPVSSPTTAERREVVSEFLAYALSKPMVRVRPVADILTWMKNPVALGGSCTSNCTDRECGPDGCGGTCGSCIGNETCDDGQCESCMPACSGKSCGPDGCGGTCGSCIGSATCNNGQCQSCVPACSGKSCGSDGCGGVCGSCPSGQSCNAGGQCGAGPCASPAWVANTEYALGTVVTDTCNMEVTGCVGKVGKTVAFRSKSVFWSTLRPGHGGGWWDAWDVISECSGTCVPSCSGKTCGNDGCGGSCGTCGGGQACNGSGQCQSTCVPSCSGKTCGGDGCGGTCGSCGGGQTCNASGQCQSTCVPSCSGKSCGGDGCGGSCGSCGGGQTCNASGQCQSTCVPSCSGKTCGTDGCGGTCGTCGSGQTCSTQNQCVTSSGGCSSPAWTSKEYVNGEQVTATCQASTVGTTCFGNVGKKFAWRCTNPGWCKDLAPGGNAGGWWSAWESIQSCL